MSRTLGYVRVSTEDKNQSVDGQQTAIINAGFNIPLFFADNTSGKVNPYRRPGFSSLMKIAKPGDTIVVTELTRLSRSTLDTLTLLENLKKADIAVISLADKDLSTDTPDGLLKVGLLALLSQRERMIISVRTKAGLAHARACGKRLGRPKAEGHDQAAQLLKGGMSVPEVAAATGLATRTIYKIRQAQSQV
ncbi:recombinase family protein [Salmonella enterica]|nr:recombinase family protein [Salmonella enterica]